MSLGGISVSQFASHLEPLWQRLRLRAARTGLPPIAGISVSGGPDSMALAHLLAQCQREGYGPEFKLQAFIIDHQLRPGSGEEAITVSQRLSSMGISSRIFKMKWASEIVQPQDFERLARVKRYRLLARAAVPTGIRDLVTGHHQDDQVETIFMRLLRTSNPSFSALQGMTSLSSIPCCEDIYGARQGEILMPADSLTHRHNSIHGLEQYQRSNVNDQNAAFGICSDDGVKLHRPLLPFTKSQIIQTCKSHGLEYVEDKTNYDPKSTLRNTVRFLRSAYKLPRALGHQRMLQLHENSTAKMERLRKRRSKQLELVKISSFDVRTDLMKVDIPKERLEKDDQVVAYMLNQLLQPIQPKLNSMKPAWVTVDVLNSFIPFQPAERIGGTFRGVKFQPLPSSGQSSSQSETWQLYRQPLRPGEIQKLTVKFESSKKTPKLSKWILWDGRYWIRIRCLDAKDVSSFFIRTYTKKDARDIREHFEVIWKHPTGGFNALNRLLNNCAPGDVRFTLPVLADEHEVLAFPTLNFVLPRRKTPASSKKVRFPQGWEVRHKFISNDLLDAGCFSTTP